MFLVIMDAYSKWIDVFEMSKITAAKTVVALRQCFVFGDCLRYLSSCVSAEILKNNGVKHITTVVYVPQSNGAAEKSFKTFKASFKKQKVN
ncbi:hypothetical protein PR048_022326 [Dryococelus australis]|uniref:Integrase catalytic domain-containing protein n=1 Tax=Dryococelus australis TaxID=614101 RepID=A0ABQ9H0U4_9NEOP|nr:hypothetical protein PR048_022326 [Dryococelus australis]